MDLIIKLPEKIPCKFSKKALTEISKLKPEEKSLIESNKLYIEKNSYKWKIDKNFKFNLPKSFFSNLQKKQTIDISHNLQQKSTSTSYASNNLLEKETHDGIYGINELLKQIWEEGKFIIPSTTPDLPYSWKLSNFIIKGYNNIAKRYYKDMALAFKFFYTIKNRFRIKNYFYRFPINFLSCFYHLYMTIRLLFNALVGIPLYMNNFYKLREKIQTEDLERFIQLNPDFNYKLYSPENKKHILLLDTDYKINFPNLSQFLQTQQIINEENFNLDEEYKQKYDEFLKKLEKSSIRILCSDWKEEKIEEYEKLQNQEKVKLILLQIILIK